MVSNCSPGRSQNTFIRLCGAWNSRSNRGVPLGESNTLPTASSHGSGFCFTRLFTCFGPPNTAQSKASLNWHYSPRFSSYCYFFLHECRQRLVSERHTTEVCGSQLLLQFFTLHCFKRHFALISVPEKMTLCDLVDTINIHTYLQGRNVSFDWKKGQLITRFFLLLVHTAWLYMWRNVEWRHAERRRRETQQRWWPLPFCVHVFMSAW